MLFSPAGYSWDRSPELRAALTRAASKASVPMLFIHAANDYSLSPGKGLDAGLASLGRPHSLKIYPPVGNTAEEGHNFVYLGAGLWETDVFAFLDVLMRPKP